MAYPIKPKQYAIDVKAFDTPEASLVFTIDYTRLDKEMVGHVIGFHHGDDCLLSECGGDLERALVLKTVQWAHRAMVTQDWNENGLNCEFDEMEGWPGEGMIKFFRNDDLGINPGYWAEKLQAGPGIAPDEITKEWQPEEFRSEIKDWFDDATEDWDEEDKAEAWEEVESEVLGEADNEHTAITAAMDFRFNDKELFQDFWEVDCKQWKGHYLWCCYAIVWAIQQYDAAKEGA